MPRYPNTGKEEGVVCSGIKNPIKQLLFIIVPIQNCLFLNK